VRNLSEPQVLLLVAKNTQGRQLGILGEKTVNVLELNLALEALSHQK
jgi:K+-transporting ATPase ATPase C chain